MELSGRQNGEAGQVELAEDVQHCRRRKKKLPSGSTERRAQSLMDLAVELKPSLRLPEFVGQFTQKRSGKCLARGRRFLRSRAVRIWKPFMSTMRAGIPTRKRGRIWTRL